MRKLLLLACSTLLAGSAAGIQAKPMKWMDATGAGLPAGATMAVVKGDPGKAGEFTVRIKMPANYAVPPHHHPTDEIVRVVSAGTLSYGMGDKLDRSNVGALTKGFHVTMTANMNHYVFTIDPVEVQVDGMGPFQITYVDPKDDPRTK
jgi:hypothetical protein